MTNTNNGRDVSAIRAEIRQEEANLKTGIKNDVEFAVIKVIRQKIKELTEELNGLLESKKEN